MGRWEPAAADRLQRAALELFLEQGYADTTVPQITARAGLTTRTFFRHFPDKREVLFAGESELPGVVARLFAESDPTLSPLEVIVDGLCGVVASRLEGQRDYFQARRAVIQSDSGLRERELHKLSLLARAGETGFRERGLSPLHAAVAARLAVTVFDLALQRWLDSDTGLHFAAAVTQTAAALTDLTDRPTDDLNQGRVEPLRS